MIRRPPRSTRVRSSAASDVYKRQASAERGSEHPLGEAIVEKARELGLALSDAGDFKAVPGHGIEVTVDGARLLLGNLKLMSDRGIEAGALEQEAERLATDGKTPMFVAADGRLAGIIAVADTLKPNSVEAVARLRKMGLQVVMICLLYTSDA